jgi:protein phosphatase
MRIELPEPCLVVLIGATGSGKSTFAASHFLPSEVVSSDFCRGLVSDDPNDQSATEDAFAVLHEIAGRRLRRGKLTVVDATNVQKESRAALMRIAREHDLFAVAIVLDTADDVCAARNASRADRSFGAHVIHRQRRELKRSLKFLQREGFRRVSIVRPGDDVSIARAPMWTDRRGETGPFDIIGDVHGCYEELCALLDALGYVDGVHPEGRRLVFVGDLVDRGPGVRRRAPARHGIGGRDRRPGQPRFQARPQVERPGRPDHAWVGGDAGAARG